MIVQRPEYYTSTRALPLHIETYIGLSCWIHDRPYIISQVTLPMQYLNINTITAEAVSERDILPR